MKKKKKKGKKENEERRGRGERKVCQEFEEIGKGLMEKEEE